MNAPKPPRKRERKDPLEDPAESFRPGPDTEEADFPGDELVVDPVELEMPTTEQAEQENVLTIVNSALNGRIGPKVAGVALAGLKLLHEMRAPKAPKTLVVGINATSGIGSPADAHRPRQISEAPPPSSPDMDWMHAPAIRIPR